MNATENHSEAVWEKNLPQLRSTRRKRRYRRVVASAAACGALAAMGLSFQADKTTVSPVVRTDPAPPLVETIAVMRIDDQGAIRLEEIDSTELGQIELVFGQAPIVSYDLHFQ